MSVTVGGIRYSRSVIHFNTSHSLYSADNHMTRQTSVWKGTGCSSLPDDVIEPGSISEADLTADSKPRGKRRRKDGADMTGGAFLCWRERNRQLSAMLPNDIPVWNTEPISSLPCTLFLSLPPNPPPLLSPPLSALQAQTVTDIYFQLAYVKPNPGQHIINIQAATETLHTTVHKVLYVAQCVCSVRACVSII